MSTLSPLSSRQYQPASLPVANQQTDSKNLRAGNSSLMEKAQNDLVSLSKNGIDLQQRVESLGNSTVDLAQNLLGSFAQQMFGDAGKGATVSFNSVSLESSSSFAAGVQQSQGANGTTFILTTRDQRQLSRVTRTLQLGEGRLLATPAATNRTPFRIQT